VLDVSDYVQIRMYATQGVKKALACTGPVAEESTVSHMSAPLGDITRH